MSEERKPPAFKEGDTHDVKMARTVQEPDVLCWKCRGIGGVVHHQERCPHVDLPSAVYALKQARGGEKWARDRAAYWLGQVRQMYATQANLKNEIKILRKRCKNLENQLKEKS